MKGDFFDPREGRDPELRESQQFATLQSILRHALDRSPAWADRLKGVETVPDRTALAELPVLRKSDLAGLQKDRPPFGGLATRPTGDFLHLFTSPGSIHEPGHTGDFWRMAPLLYAAGFRKGDIVHNTFSYHFTPAGFMMEQAAHAIGCAVVPAGVGNTDLQLETLQMFRANRFAGTPAFLVILLEAAEEKGFDLSSLSSGVVGGAALPPSVRERIGEFGVQVLQSYGTADVGQIAFESVAGEALLLDEDVIVELVEPGGSRPVEDDETGEVVVTLLNPDYPLIRFGTGDLSRKAPGLSSCGRTAPRIAGWLGRADQATKVRGLFVHPGQVGEICRRHPEAGKARLVVGSEEHRDTVVLRVEANERGDALAQALGRTAQAVLRIRTEVELVPPDTLPDDGKAIEDIRTYG